MTETNFRRRLSRTTGAQAPVDAALTNENEEEQQGPTSKDEEQKPKTTLPKDECDRPQAPRLLPSTPTTGRPQAPLPPPSVLTANRQLGEYLTRR